MEEETQKKSGMTVGTWMILIGVAIFLDVVKWVLLLIPVVGEILGMFVDWIGTGINWLVLHMHGEKFSKTTLISGWVVGMIPVIGEIIPEQTLVVVKLYFDWKAKQVIADKIPGGKMALQVAAANQARKPNVTTYEAKVPGVQPLTAQGAVKNRALDTASYNQTSNTQKSPEPPPIPKQNRSQSDNASENIKRREEINRELIARQQKALADKHYEGGYEKFKSDGEKHTADWNRAKESREKFEGARLASIEEDKKLNGGPMSFDKTA